jgi:hypothetical protein
MVIGFLCADQIDFVGDQQQAQDQQEQTCSHIDISYRPGGSFYKGQK